MSPDPDTVAGTQQEEQFVVYGVIHADAAVENLHSQFHRHYPFINNGSNPQLFDTVGRMFHVGMRVQE